MSSINEKTCEYELLGHDDLLIRVSNLVSADRLPPVVLFHGREGIGKRVLLTKVVQTLLCESKDACGQCSSCQKVLFGNHPDYLLMDPDAKTLKLDDAKNIQDHLSLNTSKDSKRIVAISDVERLNVQAVNRLLKTFEEPPENVIILMSTGSLRSILDTLRSRAIKWNVKPPKKEVFAEVIRKHCLVKGYSSPNDAEVMTLIRKAGYSPGKAIKFLDAQNEGGGFDISDIFREDVEYAKAIEKVGASLKSVKLTPKQVLAESEEQLNSFYRKHLLSEKPAALNATKIVRRRELLSNFRKVTMSNETAFNVSMTLEAIASS